MNQDYSECFHREQTGCRNYRWPELWWCESERWFWKSGGRGRNIIDLDQRIERKRAQPAAQEVTGARHCSYSLDAGGMSEFPVSSSSLKDTAAPSHPHPHQISFYNNTSFSSGEEITVSKLFLT
ncbi:hypothetical protein Tco_0600634 [Tanacetum coccineum]